MSHSSPADSPPRPPQAGGFGLVARRIGGWTANLLASAILLVATLAIGRQIIDWWRESAPASTGSTTGGTSDLPAAAPREMQWWTARGPLFAEDVRGDREAALFAMRIRCLTWPGDRMLRHPADVPPAGPGEQRYVARLANEQPLEQTEYLDLYQPSGEPTMMVAVARRERRIAAWSFALPRPSVGGGESVWTCYTIHAVGGVTAWPDVGAPR